MGYCGLMGYGVKFSAHRLGGLKKVWVKRVYGLSQAWVMRGSTVDWFRVQRFWPYKYCHQSKSGKEKCEIPDVRVY
jgi:hypothetical protein